jgi:hypothetical protein
LKPRSSNNKKSSRKYLRLTQVSMKCAFGEEKGEAVELMVPTRARVNKITEAKPKDKDLDPHLQQRQEEVAASVEAPMPPIVHAQPQGVLAITVTE